MKYKKFSIVLRAAIFFTGAILLAPAIALSKGNPRCEPNPLFNAFPNSYSDGCERSRFAPLDIQRWKDREKKRDVETIQVEGEYWYYFDLIENDAKGMPPGKLEIQRNYVKAVQAAKGTVLHLQDNKGLTYHIRRNDGEFWGYVGCGRGGADDCSAIMHKIIRAAPMEQSVVMNSKQIAKSIFDEGKAVFYGLYFDTDKSTLKPESAPTLAEIAKWLKENASTNVFIVGHTDMQGSVEHNLSLSRSRADAVINALIKQHGIKAERLKAEGVASFAPVSNNTAEAGRAKNRRVEMVLR